MSQPTSRYVTVPIEADDASAGFSCGKHSLDDYFRRHAASNDAAGIGRTYVLHREAQPGNSLPRVLGYYTLSMAVAAAAQVSGVIKKKLPRYPLPVALVGRLAIDQRAQGRRFGELLLMDALRRVVDAAAIVGCVGVVVDAKDDDAERFYAKYDFSTVAAEGWPRRMFLPIRTAQAAFEP